MTSMKPDSNLNRSTLDFAFICIEEWKEHKSGKIFVNQHIMKDFKSFGFSDLKREIANGKKVIFKYER